MKKLLNQVKKKKRIFLQKQRIRSPTKRIFKVYTDGKRFLLIIWVISKIYIKNSL